MAEDMSEKMKQYVAQVEDQVNQAYAIAAAARAKGFDPEEEVNVPLAKNMAQRVEGIVSTVCPGLLNSGLSQRLHELEKTFGELDWRVALKIAEEVAEGKFSSFESKIKGIETGIRVGIAYLTLGIVASPLEGFVELKVKQRFDGKEFFSLMYSGPIRSAGGTAAAVSVIVADYLRVVMGYSPYDPTEEEVQRVITEMRDYHERVANLQYFPTEEESSFLLRRLPVQINGDPSEEMEVSNFKDLPRIETNRIRSGVCLVLAEGVAQKAKKVHKQLSKWAKDFQLSHWGFLEEFLTLQKKVKAKGSTGQNHSITPVYTYIEDLVAGRPVLAHPLRVGGFRLRYGRARASGYSSACVHPGTMYILNQYLAIGTQLKVERPGKAAALSSCDTIEGPIVLLEDDRVVRIENLQQAKHYFPSIKGILFLGDILFSFGDFFNRAHTLLPPGYCEEWWVQEVEKAVKEQEMRNTEPAAGNAESSPLPRERLNILLGKPSRIRPTPEEAIQLSMSLGVPLHPSYTYHWNSISSGQLVAIAEWFEKSKIVSGEQSCEKIVLPWSAEHKEILGFLGMPHVTVGKEFVVLENPEATIIARMFSIGEDGKLSRFREALLQDANAPNLEVLNRYSPFMIKDKSGFFIGARMGRPEKAKMRKLTGSPHVLFPVGSEGGKHRSFQTALEAGKIVSDSRLYRCTSCNKESLFGVCEVCGSRTKKVFFCHSCGVIDVPECTHGKALPYRECEIPIGEILSKVQLVLGERVAPDLIKGVRGTSNKEHSPEHLAKGILRAKHDVFVNKDGTTRYDMTQLVITHFKPKEIGTPVERLRELGYDVDCRGNALIGDDQVLELKPQDVILPSCPESPDEGADTVFFRMANFVDDLLEKLYKLPRYYCLSTKKELVGHLINALAPHISSSVVGRIIGFSKTQGFYAHPMFHAAMRRDCDGDEASATLLLDTLLNFSRQFLPNNRGATQDAPLVLTSQIIPGEVDDMLFDVDVGWRYPLAFYEAACAFQEPGQVVIDQIGKRLHTPLQYEGMGFTHGTSDINEGVGCSAYKTLPSMEEKLRGQMELAEKIRAVDQADVARLVIEKHFIRDIKGNLRKFSTQEFRCVACNEKFRRPPLAGSCTACSGKLLFTVSEGSIVKYLEPAISLAQKYNLHNYIKHSLELTKRMVESIFGKDKEKQAGLGQWFKME